MTRAAAERSDLLPLLGECFREHGDEGANRSKITAATGLGKGSFYHFFPGGKEQMLTEALGRIDSWFERSVLALADTRDRFAEPIRSYFSRWIAALAGALTRDGHPTPRQEAEDMFAAIQGAILLSRALDDAAVLTRSVALLRGRFTD